MLGRVKRQVNRGWWHYPCGNEKPSRILFRNEDLFLAQKIKVSVTTGARIDDSRKVTREVVGISITIIQGKSKGNLQRDLRCTDEFAAAPRLTVNRDITAGSNCIQ